MIRMEEKKIEEQKPETNEKNNKPKTDYIKIMKNIFKKFIAICKKVWSLIKKLPYKPAIILIILLIVALVMPKRLPKIFTSSKYSKIEKICNLATIEAYYHNVAYDEIPASGVGKVFGNIGYKKYWLEFDTILKLGVNAKKVKISNPNRKNEVHVYIPPAEILNEPDWIHERIGDPITDTGFLTSISNEDETRAVANAIAELKKNANEDDSHLELAREKAKRFFENYIVNAGREIGVEYTVIFDEQ